MQIEEKPACEKTFEPNVWVVCASTTVEQATAGSDATTVAKGTAGSGGLLLGGGIGKSNYLVLDTKLSWAKTAETK